MEENCVEIYLGENEIIDSLDWLTKENTYVLEHEKHENEMLLHLLYRMGYLVVSCDDKYYLTDSTNSKCSDEKTLNEMVRLFDAIKMNMQKYVEENVMHYTKE